MARRGLLGASIDTGDAEQVARGLIGEDRTKLHWEAARVLLPKNKVKLVLNLCLIATAAIPRGGDIRVSIAGDGVHLSVEATGTNARVAAHVPGLLALTPENGSVDAHGIQAYYTGLVAQACGMELKLETAPERVLIQATQKAEAAAPAETEAVASHA